MLIAARGVQGVAGALLVPSSLALIIDTFDQERARRGDRDMDRVDGHRHRDRPARRRRADTAASWRWIFAINPFRSLVTADGCCAGSRADRRATGARRLGRRRCCACLGLGGTVFALIEQPALRMGRPPRVRAADRRTRAARRVPRVGGARARADDAAPTVRGAQLRGRERRRRFALYGGLGVRPSSSSCSSSRLPATRRSRPASRCSRSRS